MPTAGRAAWLATARCGSGNVVSEERPFNVAAGSSMRQQLAELVGAAQQRQHTAGWSGVQRQTEGLTTLPHKRWNHPHESKTIVVAKLAQINVV